MEEQQTVGITFGLMGKTIPEQLKKQGFELNDTDSGMEISRGEYIELNRTAFNRLRLASFLTDSESDKVNKRMMKYIVKHLNPINKKPDTTDSHGIPNNKK